MKKILLAISLTLTLWLNVGIGAPPVLVSQVYNQGDPAENQPYYNIGIKRSGPFAYITDEKEWDGLSVDLIAMLAERLNFSYRFISADTVPALLELSEKGKVDLSIGAISMTDSREKVIDFSHSYFTTPQGILVKQNGNDLLLLAGEMSIWVVYLVIYLLIAGWLAAKIDPKDGINTTEIGTWFVWVTTTTVGYGDFAPKCLRTRLFAGMVMFISLFGVSAFTAKMASILTVDRLAENIVTLADLNKAKVVAIKGTTTDYLLNMLEIKHDFVKTPGEGVSAVKDGKAKAFVYDKAMLDYLVLKGDNTSLAVQPINRGLERYAIAFPSESKLREPFNVKILAMIDSTEWKKLTAQYFGN